MQDNTAMGHQPRLQASLSRCDNRSPHGEPGYEGGPSPWSSSLHTKLEQGWQAPVGTGQVMYLGTVLDSGAVYPRDHKMTIPLTGHQVWGQDDSASVKVSLWPLDILRDYHMF